MACTLGGPAKRDTGQELALGRDQGGSDTQSRMHKLHQQRRPPSCPRPQESTRQGQAGRQAGGPWVETSCCVSRAPGTPATTLRPSGSHTEAAAVTSPPFLRGTGARRDKASQLASLGPEPGRQTAPQAEEAPAICRHPTSNPAPPPSPPLPLPQGPVGEHGVLRGSLSKLWTLLPAPDSGRGHRAPWCR